MMRRPLSILIVIVGMSNVLSGFGQPQARDQGSGSEQRDGDAPYVPKPLPSSATLESVKDDLAALLRARARPVGIRFGDVQNPDHLEGLVRKTYNLPEPHDLQRPLSIYAAAAGE